MEIDVPVTGTNYSQGVYDQWCSSGAIAHNLQLERDPDNPHDHYAVKVMFGRQQMGWVAKKHSRQVAERLDAGRKLLGLSVRYNTPRNIPMDRCQIRLRFDEAVKPIDQPIGQPIATIKVFGAPSQAPSSYDLMQRMLVGTILNCVSTSMRSSVSLQIGSKDFAWFRKEEPGNELTNEHIMWANRGALVGRIDSQSPLTVSLFRKGDIKESVAYQLHDKPVEEIFAVRIGGKETVSDTIIAGSISATSITGSKLNPQGASMVQLYSNGIDSNGIVSGSVVFGSNASQNNNPSKENTMNAFFSKLIAINTKAAGDAAYLETGRIANNVVIKMITARLPFMARFYAKTPFGKLATANAAIALVQQLRPNDERLQRLA